MDRSSIALVAAGAWLWVSPGMAELPCRIVPIDTAGGYGAHVTALNNWGQVVGAVLYETGPMTAYVWYRGNTRTLPPWQPGGFSFATSINNLGLIVGFAQEGQTDIPVLWLAGKIRRLPGGEARPTDINNFGQIVGNRGFSECLFWPSPSSEPIVLGNFGGDYCFARAINDRGQIVGGAETATGVVHAFVWQDGVLTDLGDYPHEGAALTMELLDINNRGLAVGRVLHGLETELLLWTAEEGPRVIEFPNAEQPMIQDATASSVNEWGLIVAHDYAEQAHLLLLSGEGGIRDAGTLGGQTSYDDVFLNERFQLAWDASLKPYFCQLKPLR